MEMGFVGRSGSVSLSDFIELVQRNSYLPTSLHRTKYKAHAQFLPDDTLTLMFGQVDDGVWFTLRTNDMPEWNERIKRKNLGDKRGTLKLGWKVLIYQLIADKMVRPTEEVKEFCGDELFNLAVKARGRPTEDG